MSVFYSPSVLALESHDETLKRLEQSRACKANKRALESRDETLKRLEQSRACKANKRALESHDETLKRLEQNRACATKKRTSESHDETVQRKHNKTSMAKKRASTIVTLNSAIASFQSKIKIGPEFVCTSCHRMMYRQNVVRTYVYVHVYVYVRAYMRVYVCTLYIHVMYVWYIILFLFFFFLEMCGRYFWTKDSTSLQRSTQRFVNQRMPTRKYEANIGSRCLLGGFQEGFTA